MKKISITALLAVALLATGCEKDNFDGPDATFFGKIIDTEGNLVPQDIIDGSVIHAYEQGFATPVAQPWYIMNSGEFRNNLVFANDYELRLQNGNFFPLTERVTIVKGDNEHNFTVTPYVTFTECDISYDDAEQKVTATFKIAPGKANVRTDRMTLYVFTDIYVCASVNLNFKVDDTNGKYSVNTNNALISSLSGTQTLTMDVSDTEVFKAGRNYYFRVGIQGKYTDENVGTIKHNYSETQKITIR